MKAGAFPPLRTLHTSPSGVASKRRVTAPHGHSQGGGFSDTGERASGGHVHAQKDVSDSGSIPQDEAAGHGQHGVAAAKAQDGSKNGVFGAGETVDLERPGQFQKKLLERQPQNVKDNFSRRWP